MPLFYALLEIMDKWMILLFCVFHCFDFHHYKNVNVVRSIYLPVLDQMLKLLCTCVFHKVLVFAYFFIHIFVHVHEIDKIKSPRIQVYFA